MKPHQNDILEAMKNEALARCRYEVYAEIAREEGLHYYAKCLEEIAKNELSHFREFMRILALNGSTADNLQTAICGERDESDDIYPTLYQNAMADGRLNTARLFQQITKIERRHLQRLERLSTLLEQDSVYRRDEPIQWKCRTCGYIHEGLEPPGKCPACQSAREFYEPADFGI